MLMLKANTAVDVLIGPFVDDTDGKTAETALTISQGDVKLSKNGQALAQKNDDTAASHDANGYYNCELDATDTNTEGNLVLIVNETGALPVRHEFNVLSQAAYDSLFTAKDVGFMDVNIKAVSEDTTAADNAEAFFDGTGYAGTNNVIPTVTTLTGHTPQTGDAFARIGAAGASLSAIPWNAAWDAEVQSEVQDAIEVNHLDHLLAVDYDPASKPGTATALLNELVESDAGVSRFTVNALENAPSGSGASAETIADAVWDEVLSGHMTAGTAGKVIGDNINAPIGTVDAVVDALTVELAKVPKSDGEVLFNAICVGNIKSGLTTTSMLPANFVDMAITATTGRVTVGTNADKTGYSLIADQSAVTVGTVMSVGTVTGNVNGSVGSVTGSVGSVLGSVGSVSGNVDGSVASVVAGVTLANGAHGGAAATITAKSIAVTNSDAGGIAVTLTGSGTGNSHALALNSTSGSAVSAVAGSHAISINSSAGNGLVVNGNTGDIVGDITGTLSTCTTNTDMITTAAIKTAIEADGGDLSSLMEALVNKRIWTEASGNLEIFNDAGVSQGTIAAQATSDGTYTTAKRTVI